jgi:hypothetical protein
LIERDGEAAAIATPIIDTTDVMLGVGVGEIFYRLRLAALGTSLHGLFF